jgi:hypothetical protein
MVTAWDNLCVSHKFAQRTPHEENKQFYPWRNLCLAGTSSIHVHRRHHGSAQKKRWTTTIPRSRRAPWHTKMLLIWVDEPDRRTRWDQSFVARRQGISMSSTSSNAIKEEERHRLSSSTHLTTRHNHNNQHDRHLRECRLSTTRHKYKDRRENRTICLLTPPIGVTQG